MPSDASIPTKPTGQSFRRAVPEAPVNADEIPNPHMGHVHFIHERWKANLCIAVAVLSLVLAGEMMIRHVKATERKGYAFVVGEDGTTVYGRLRGLNPDSGVYKRFLLHVVRLRAQLTPDGLSDPEGAEAVFVDMAKDRLMADIKRWTAQAQTNNLYSQPFISSYKKIAERGDSPVYEIRGHCLISGAAGGMAIREKEPFIMIVRLAPNPKLDKSEMLDAPFVVTEYSGWFSQREIDRERERRLNEKK